MELGRALRLVAAADDGAGRPAAGADDRRRHATDLVRRGEAAEPHLVATDLTVVRGGTVAVREVSVRLDAGSVTALMGRNGSGKSTLLWTLQGSRARRAGTVRVDGVDPAAAPARRRRELVGLVPQTAADLLYLESVADECSAADGGLGPAGFG